MMIRLVNLYNLFGVVIGTHLISRQPDSTKITYNLTQGKDFPYIRCGFTGDSAITITWQWDGENGDKQEPDYYFIIIDGTVQIGPLSYETTSTLALDNTLSLEKQKLAEGNLIASAAHGGHTLTCNSVTVDLQWKPEKPSLSINKDRLVIGKDSTLQLTCQITDEGNPEGQVRWIKNGSQQSESEYNTETISIPVTKDIHGDKLQCYYSNAAGDGDYSDEVFINVHWKPEQPSLSINKDPLAIGEDSTAQLTCQLTDNGNPEGQIRWIKNGNLQSESEYNTHTISIPVTWDINGDKWQCYYYNTAGDGDYSNKSMVNVHCLPYVHIDYITYEFTSGYVNFNLKTKNAFAASTLEVSVCSLDDSPPCEVAKSNIEQNINLEQSVRLPESSDGAVYNVTFTFSNYQYIVTQHGIALKGTVVQSQVPKKLAVLFGTFSIVAIVTIIALVYVFKCRNKATGTNVQSENSVHYVNVGSEGNSDGITHMQATPEYEDVNTAATANGQSSNIENTTYIDLDQNDIQQIRNRPADATVYQSLN